MPDPRAGERDREAAEALLQAIGDDENYALAPVAVSLMHASGIIARARLEGDAAGYKRGLEEALVVLPSKLHEAQDRVAKLEAALRLPAETCENCYEDARAALSGSPSALRALLVRAVTAGGRNAIDGSLDPGEAEAIADRILERKEAHNG